MANIWTRNGGPDSSTNCLQVYDVGVSIKLTKGSRGERPQESRKLSDKLDTFFRKGEANICFEFGCHLGFSDQAG